MHVKRCCLWMLPVLALATMAHADLRSKTFDAKDVRWDSKAKNAKMLIQTLSEEKTEINALTAQQAQFRKMGGAENVRIASMYGRWVKEHKAGGPMFMRLINENGGDPRQAKILKPPVLGSREKMLTATHKDHKAAVASSKARANMTTRSDIKEAMMKRVALASKHLKQMAPYHHAMKM